MSESHENWDTARIQLSSSPWVLCVEKWRLQWEKNSSHGVIKLESSFFLSTEMCLLAVLWFWPYSHCYFCHWVMIDASNYVRRRGHSENPIWLDWKTKTSCALVGACIRKKKQHPTRTSHSAMENSLTFCVVRQPNWKTTCVITSLFCIDNPTRHWPPSSFRANANLSSDSRVSSLHWCAVVLVYCIHIRMFMQRRLTLRKQLMVAFFSKAN